MSAQDINEVTEALGRTYGTPDGVGEEDLEAELACLGDELESAELDAQPSYLSAASSLPSQPTSLPTLPAQAAAQPAASAVDEYGLPLNA